MAEAIAFAASIVSIIQLAGTLITLCRAIIQTTRDAPKDLRVILLEASSVRSTLDNVLFLYGNEQIDASEPLSGLREPVNGCRRCLNELVALLPSTSNTTSTSENGQPSKRQRIATALAWPLKEARAHKLLDELAQYKATITMVLIGDVARDVKQIKAGVNTIQAAMSDAQIEQVLKWLEHTNPSSIHNRSCALQEQHTCTWMLRSPEWRQWLMGTLNQRLLWISGIPGAGKTILASFLIQTAKEHTIARESDRIIHVYYYCYFAHNQDEGIPLLRWVVSQLCQRAKRIPDGIRETCADNHAPTVACLLSALSDILKDFDVVYLFIDAVDESQAPRDEILRILRSLATEPCYNNLRLLATSRDYHDIETNLLGTSTRISMSNSLVEEDIRTYVHSALRSSRKFSRLPAPLLTEIEDALVKGAKGMFRWAVCQIDILGRLYAESDIRAALRSLPRTLDETYERIFSLIPDEQRVLVRQVLINICAHNDSRVDSVYSDVLVSAAMFQLYPKINENEKTFIDSDSLKDICGCLVTISRDEEGVELYGEGTFPDHANGNTFDYDGDFYDPGPTVSFAHYTVREYLESDRISCSCMAFFSLSEATAMREFARTAFSKVLNIKDKLSGLGSLDDHWCCTADQVLANVGSGSTFIEDDKLHQLVFALLDPSKPHFNAFAGYIQDHERYDSKDSFFWGGVMFAGVHWVNVPSNPFIAIFANLIAYGEDACAERLLKHADTTTLLDEKFDVRCHHNAMDLFDYKISQGYLLNLLEDHLQKFTSETMPSSALIHHVVSGRFFKWECCCGWEYLTRHKCCCKWWTAQGCSEWGIWADLDTPEYGQTPLQVAVRQGNCRAVEALLYLEADPNGIGTPGGIMLEYMDKEWSNASPLDICRHAPMSELDRDNIEKMLLDRLFEIEEDQESSLLDCSTSEG
ncbi:hypothetical protein NA57DRAFT_72640 [Rhizodiscina lignyota]|uniref:NACHT domain-containing protein n=1 Tax=Rhizodiscina lignyota TaxID=1504668 RepID=A0A9P4IK86_9PEZI|nr:hypothetical protein NA57DRAFT_72640 [Rhizodiscina lignyota]